MKRLVITCAALAMLSGAAMADPLAGYEPMDLTDYKPREGASALLLLQDLIEGHPEALDGKPEMRINVQGTKDGNALQIDVEMTGFLDDSVAGERFRAIVVEGTKRGWRLEKLGKQTMCGRGDAAGKWVTTGCP